MKANQTDECLKCHSNKNVKDYNTSIHSKKNVGCNGCHKVDMKSEKISKSEISSGPAVNATELIRLILTIAFIRL